MRLGALALVTFGLAGAGIALTLASPPRQKIMCESILVTLPNGTHITAEIADTWSKRARGLSDRDSLAVNHGMLFLFDRADTHTFWMKDTRIPLDILWLNNGQIVDMTTLQPESTTNTPQYTPRTPANTVLELNAGTAEANHLRVGETITWQPCT